MKSFVLIALLSIVSFQAHSQTITRCKKVGAELVCETQSREEADTPSAMPHIGSGFWCLVSNAPIKKYNCGYMSREECMRDANIDNMWQRVSSCRPNN